MVLEVAFKKEDCFCELRFILGIGFCKRAKIHRFFVKICQIASCEGFRRKAPLFLSSVLSVSFDLLVPTHSPFGPTSGCSFSPLPRCSIVVKSAFFSKGREKIAEGSE